MKYIVLKTFTDSSGVKHVKHDAIDDADNPEFLAIHEGAHKDVLSILKPIVDPDPTEKEQVHKVAVTDDELEAILALRAKETEKREKAAAKKAKEDAKAENKDEKVDEPLE